MAVILDIAAPYKYCMDAVLQVENLRKHYAPRQLFGKKTPVKAVDGVSFSLKAGTVFVLAGESGSGKSTVARLILGAEEADGGFIHFEGERVDYDTGSGVNAVRRGCQMVHQNPYDSINPRMRVMDIVAEPLKIHGYKKQREKRVMDVLRQVKLEPVHDIAAMLPHQLSGGQRQRVVLARAMAPRPKVIIADEPVSMLDVSIRAEILGIMESLRTDYGVSFLYITHDLATARYFGDEIAIMYRGRVVETGRIGDVLDSPKHPYTKALIDAVSYPDPENLKREKIVRVWNGTSD